MLVFNESHFTMNHDCKNWINYNKLVFESMHEDIIKGIKMDSSNRVPLLLKLHNGLPQK